VIDRDKFIKDWTANAVSLGMLAVTGLLLNSLIAKIYGTAALGIFNQVYAVYIFGAQIATFGIQFSVLRHLSDAGQDHARASRILGAALRAVAVPATATVLFLFACFKLLGGSLYSVGVAESIILMLPGLWCFAVDKVLLNALNGIEANSLYAVFTGLRYLLILVCLIGAIAIELPGEQLGLILTVSEGMLFLAIVAVCLQRFSGVLRFADADWIAVHRRFGARSILAGLAIELNSRVDVLILGVFTSDAIVGVYSFAAFFVEGLLQLTVISRRLVDPILTRLAANDVAALLALLRHGRNLGALSAVILGCAAVLAYPWYATIAGTRELATASWPVFAMLMIGACVFAVYATFGDIFSQTGRPAVQSRLNVAILGSNIALNFMLVPFYGLIGAAVATCLSFIIGTLYFRALVRRHLAVDF
jgi:O-antigen/teichoic acid export membrane protein